MLWVWSHWLLGSNYKWKQQIVYRILCLSVFIVLDKLLWKFMFGDCFDKNDLSFHLFLHLSNWNGICNFSNESSTIGREIVTRFEISNFKNKGIFYTDSNGREIIRRSRDVRENFQFDPSDEQITSNYYPVTSKIIIRDNDKNLEVAILNDRSQGGTSLLDGKIELMVSKKKAILLVTTHRCILIENQQIHKVPAFICDIQK